MIQEYIKQPHWACWPFWVLDLNPEATIQDIEKSARDLTTKIEFGMDIAKQFLTPIGTFERDEYLIREAKSCLQNPETRLLAEFWYILPEPITAKKTDVKTSKKNWLELLKVH